MTIQHSGWSPDTCGCEFEYAWDDEIPELNRVETVTAVPRKDTIHQAFTDMQQHYAAVREENQRKNRTMGIAKSHDDRVDDTNYMWSFSPERRLDITLTGLNLSATKKAAIIADCALAFGPGRVQIL